MRRFLAGMIAGSLLMIPVSLGATPLDDLIAPKDGNSACFSRLYDDTHLQRHPKQKTVAVTVWLKYEKFPGTENPALKIGIGMKRRDDPQLLFAQGSCIWVERANRDIRDRRLIPQFKKNAGADCLMSAQPDVFESLSAEEGGYLIIDRGKDANTLMAYLDDGMLMVKRAKRSGHLSIDFDSDDRVFQLQRTDIRNCAAVEDAVTTPEKGK